MQNFDSTKSELTPENHKKNEVSEDESYQEGDTEVEQMTYDSEMNFELIIPLSPEKQTSSKLS